MAKGHRGYSPADLILALMYAIIAGLRRINKVEICSTTASSSIC